jgi:hypothetical protein
MKSVGRTGTDAHEQRVTLQGVTTARCTTWAREREQECQVASRQDGGARPREPERADHVGSPWPERDSKVTGCERATRRAKKFI